MKFMVFVMADQSTEAGVLPTTEQMAEMGRFNEELVKAGVMLAGDGLQPTSKGARVIFSGDKRVIVDGPFTESKDLIAGYWLWEVGSKAEAIDWVKRCPNPTGEHSRIEIRQVYEASDFGEAFTPELQAQEEELRSRIAQK